MPDELSKFSERSGFIHSAHRIGTNYPSSNATTPLSRFLRRVSEMFNGTSSTNANLSTDAKLRGRIIEMQTAADDVLYDLIHFKNDCKQKVDSNLFVVVCSLIDPVIKELTRLQMETKRNEGATQQVKTFSRYTLLIDKARFWIQLKEDQSENQQILNAVIQQSIHDFHGRIDRDIQLINDYLIHALDGIEVADELRNELKTQMMPTLSPTILRLCQLKESKQELSFDSLVLWRSTADQTRESLFSASLHAIDTFFSDFLPSPVKENESELALVLLAQLVHLEEKVVGISELARHKKLDRSQRSAATAMLDKLEEEAHELNRNLRLSHEHSERVSQTLETILILRKKLS